jgi:hypothetical protein
MPERNYLGCNLEIAVIVNQGHVVCTGEGGDEKIGHADSAVAACAGQPPLCVQCSLPVFVVGLCNRSRPGLFERQTATNLRAEPPRLSAGDVTAASGAVNTRFPD